MKAARALLLALALTLLALPPALAFSVTAKGSIAVAFSPNGGATELIVETIGRAKTRILVQAYSFTSAPIAEAIVKAHERGVEVRVVLDKSQRSEKYTSATFLANHRVPVRIDAEHAIAHNKVMVVDEDTVITGSFNFTKAAEQRNAENVLVLRGNPELAARYAENWRQHWEHAEVYAPRYRESP